MSSCACDVFAGRLVDHLLSSVTVLFALSGVGSMRTGVPATVQCALCGLNGALSSRGFALIVVTIFIAGGRAWTDGFVSDVGPFLGLLRLGCSPPVRLCG